MKWNKRRERTNDDAHAKDLTVISGDFDIERVNGFELVRTEIGLRVPVKPEDE